MDTTGVAGLWLPLLNVSHGTADVVPVETGDVVASMILWALFWAGNVAVLLVTELSAEVSRA